MKKNNSRINHQKDDLLERIGHSTRFIKSKTKLRPRIGIILGSGLGEFAESLKHKTTIPTSSIPHYPQSTVVGHKGALIFGKLDTVPLLAFQGRVHFYENGILDSALYPIRIADTLGITTLVVTNAAGGVNRQFEAGDLMIITDQINLTFENPLLHIQASVAHQQLYDEKLTSLITKVATLSGIKLRRGIYCGLKGPSYETAAEVNMIRQIGGDAAGMSTVNEVSLANKLGMRVCGISCITNLATGITDSKLSHEEVTEVAQKVKSTFSTLLQHAIKAIANEP